MNREQMIAWLALEGWTPTRYDGSWLTQCRKGADRSLFVAIDADGSVYSNNDPADKRPPVADWDVMPPDGVKKLYRYIQEKNL